MSSIFISYRRSDSAGHAGRLHDRLGSWFDEDKLFFDRESIKGGEIFLDSISEAILKTDVVLAVIAPGWLDDTNRERLLRDDDVVRGELALALSQEKTKVISVLCGGAKVPDRLILPEDIQKLCDHHFLTLNEAGYGPSFDKLLGRLKELGLKPIFRERHDGVQPFHTNGQGLSPYFADPLRKLDALYQILHSGGTALVATVIHGMGGVGKTQLALKYSKAFRDEYSGVWWFRAGEPLQLEEDCQELCEELNIVRREDEPYSVSVRRWLKNNGGRWLLVYDNADQPTSVHPLLPGAGQHHIIYTSRSPNWSGLVKKEAMVDVESWTVEQALEFLNSRLPGVADNELRLLAETLGGLPLALEQACAYIERVNVPVETYCLHAQKLLDTAPPDTGYPHSVLATLSLAFEKLSKPAQQLLRLTAWCGPEPIPDLLFREAAEQYFPAEQDLNIKGLDPEQLEKLQGLLLPDDLRQVAADELLWLETVAELTDFALAQRVEVDLTTPGEKEIQTEQAILLHRLTQATVIHQLGDAECDGPAMTKLVRLVFPNDVETTSGWPLARALAPHVLHLENRFATGHIPQQPLSWLLNQLATYLQNGPALYDQALAIFQRNLERYKVQGEDHPETLNVMNNLATTLTAMGDHPGARVLQEQVLERSKKILGKDHPFTLTSMGNLAVTLSAMGDHQGAKALQKQVLEQRKEILGKDHPATLASMNNLAATLRAMGDHSGARALEEQVLERCKEILGEDHPHTLTSMSSLAATLGAMGDHQGAKALQEQVMKQSKEILGKDHPYTLASMNNLAVTLSAMGDHPGAKALQKQVLEQRKEILGEDHPATLTTMNNLAATLGAMGDHPGAKALQKQVLERCKKILGEDHPHTLSSMSSLAATLGAMGDHPGAKALQEQVLERRKEILGEKHPVS